MSIRESSLPKKDRQGDSDRWRPTGGHTKQVRERWDDHLSAEEGGREGGRGKVSCLVAGWRTGWQDWLQLGRGILWRREGENYTAVNSDEVWISWTNGGSSERVVSTWASSAGPRITFECLFSKFLIQHQTKLSCIISQLPLGNLPKALPETSFIS